LPYCKSRPGRPGICTQLHQERPCEIPPGIQREFGKPLPEIGAARADSHADRHPCFFCFQRPYHPDYEILPYPGIAVRKKDDAVTRQLHGMGQDRTFAVRPRNGRAHDDPAVDPGMVGYDLLHRRYRRVVGVTEAEYMLYRARIILPEP